MTANQDPLPDIYKIIDEAGLNGPTLMDSKRSTPVIINAIRTELATKLRSCMVRREHQAFNDGFHAKQVRKIEVK